MQQPPFSLLIMIPWANIHCSFFSARAVFFLSFFFLVFHYACGGSKNPSHLTFFLFVFFFFFFFLTWLRNNWSTSFSAAQRRCRSKYKHVYYLEKKRERKRECRRRSWDEGVGGKKRSLRNFVRRTFAHSLPLSGARTDGRDRPCARVCLSVSPWEK